MRPVSGSEAASDYPDETEPDKTTLTAHDKPDRSFSCDPAVDTDCSVDLTDSRPSLSVNSLLSDTHSIVTSGVEHSYFNDNVQGLRTRYGRFVRPVVRFIEHLRQKVVPDV